MAAHCRFTPRGTGLKTTVSILLIIHHRAAVDGSKKAIFFMR
jgi:hypothetical protein